MHERGRLWAVSVVAAATILLGAAYTGPSKATKNARAGCKVAWQDGLNKSIYQTSVRHIVTSFHHPLPQGISRLVDDLAADPGRDLTGNGGPYDHSGAEARIVLACYNGGYLALSASQVASVNATINLGG